MTRKKKPSAGPGAARFRANLAPDRGRDFQFVSDVGGPPREAPSHSFTLKDEARNTGHRLNAWGRVEKLRSKPVSFVSAGMIEPLKEVTTLTEDASSSEELTGAVKDMAIVDDEAPSAAPDVQMDMKPDESPQQTVTDTEFSAYPGPPAPDAAPATATNDGGDDDAVVIDAEAGSDLGFVIDVTGDKTLSAKVESRPAPKIPEPQSAAEDSDSSAEVILFKGRANLTANLTRSKPPPKQQTANRVITVETTYSDIKAAPASITADASSKHVVNLPPRSPSPSPEGPDLNTEGPEINDDGPNLDKLLASDEEEAIIADYIANMVSDSGDDNDGIPGRLLRADLGANPWAVEASSDDDSAVSGDEEDIGDSVDDGWGLNKDGQDSGEDEDEMASPTMDDETLARLLAKQEELGMGSDELILVGGQESTTYLGSTRKLRTRASMEAKIIKTRSKFPSAAAVADAFDELDVMDWERPSLQNPHKRGRRKKAPDFDVSDSDLELAMQTAWVKDREAKKAKKLQREELRSQGLLGKHANPDDPRNKYPMGMTLDDIKTEMRDFLTGTEQLLQLPPMDKYSRKVLHELAQKFKIKSVSTGSGDQRRPTLTRTKYTVKYSEEHFENASSRMERKHFPRLDMKGKGKGKARPRGGAGSAAVTYMEGEVVGASAKELGQENKGRNMLEKMGWSMGMGLGSLDNKGILQPVAHVVKRTKAGLG